MYPPAGIKSDSLDRFNQRNKFANSGTASQPSDTGQRGWLVFRSSQVYFKPVLAISFSIVLGCRLGSLDEASMDRSHGPFVPGHQAGIGQGDFAEKEQCAADSPLAFLKMCRDHYRKTVSDYRCHFHKQERQGGVIKPEEEMVVRFRGNPYSVDMRWIKNPGIAKRVTYVAGRWTDKGKELARIEPAGWVGLLFPGGVKSDIHSRLAKRAARRTIDQFGFKNTLDWIIHFCELARGDPDYNLRYVSRSTFDGRPTYLFERRLPYTGPNGPYPDRLLVFHIDCAWLVPVASFSYADDEQRSLIGRYMTTSVEFNVGLGDQDF